MLVSKVDLRASGRHHERRPDPLFRRELVVEEEVARDNGQTLARRRYDADLVAVEKADRQVDKDLAESPTQADRQGALEKLRVRK